MPPLRLPPTAVRYLAPLPHTMTRPSIIHSTIRSRCSSRMDSSTTSSHYPSIPTTTEKMLADYRAAEALREQTRMLQAQAQQPQPKVEQIDSQHDHQQTMQQIQTELREMRSKAERMDEMKKDADQLREEFNSHRKSSVFFTVSVTFWVLLNILVYWPDKPSKEQKAGRGSVMDDVETAATASNPSKEGLQRPDGARSYY
ncbi:hypothetical protein V8F06_008924 [Rhypophila decipiens]